MDNTQGDAPINHALASAVFSGRPLTKEQTPTKQEAERLCNDSLSHVLNRLRDAVRVGDTEVKVNTDAALRLVFIFLADNNMLERIAELALFAIMFVPAWFCKLIC